MTTSNVPDPPTQPSASFPHQCTSHIQPSTVHFLHPIVIEMKRVHFQWNWFFSWCLFYGSMLSRIRYSCFSWVFIYCCILYWIQFGKGCSQASNNQMSHSHIFNFIFWWWAETIFFCFYKKAPLWDHYKIIWKVVTYILLLLILNYKEWLQPRKRPARKLNVFVNKINNSDLG